MLDPVRTNPISPAAGMADAAALASRQHDFASILSRASGAGPGADKARAAAEDFVAIALVQPVLAQVRASNRAAPPFAPGPAEKQFGALVDAQIARQIVRKSGYALVDRIAQDLTKRLTAGEPGGANA